MSYSSGSGAVMAVASSPTRGADENAAGQLAVQRLRACRRRRPRVEGVDPALAVAPLLAKAIGVPFRGSDLHGRPGECLAVGLDEPSLFHSPTGEIEELPLGGQWGHDAGGIDQGGGDPPAMTLGLPPGVSRQCVGQWLTLDQRQRSAEVGDGRSRVRLRLRLGAQRHGTLHVDGDLGRDLVQAVTSPRGKERIALFVDAQGAARGVCDVEQRLACGVGVGRPQDACAQPVARHDIWPVQGQIGDELHRPTRSIRWEIVAQSVQPGSHGQEADVDGPRRERGGSIVRPIHVLLRRRGDEGRGGEGGRGGDEERIRLDGWRHQFRESFRCLGRLEVGSDDQTHGVERGGAVVDQDRQVTGRNRFHCDHRATCGQGGRQGGGVTDEEHLPCHVGLGGGLGPEFGVGGIVGHEDHVRPGP